MECPEKTLFLLIETSKSSDHYRVELPNIVTSILRGTEVYSHSKKYVCVIQLILTALNTQLHYGKTAKAPTDHKNYIELSERDYCDSKISI